MKINKKLLPIKGHYFLFNAGTAPLVPYLSTYARQLGFPAETVGLVYTVLPVCGLVAKPLFGLIADRFKIQKLLFILFQVVTIVSFGAIYFIPPAAPAAAPTAALGCEAGAVALRVCPPPPPLDSPHLHLRTPNCTVRCDMSGAARRALCGAWPERARDTALHDVGSWDDCPVSMDGGGLELRAAHLRHDDRCAYLALRHARRDDGVSKLGDGACSPAAASRYEPLPAACDLACYTIAPREEGAGSPYTRQFALFFALMVASWVGQAVVVTLADAICFGVLGDRAPLYGRQRLWGSLGWGAVSLLTGALVDALSDGAVKDYTVAFALMAVFLAGDVVASYALRPAPPPVPAAAPLADAAALLLSAPHALFAVWCAVAGLCTGLLWNFLFWHLEDVAADPAYAKTQQGLVGAVQTFAGEIPAMFVSGWVVRRAGYAAAMSVVLLAFGARFLLYSVLRDAWWALPVELLQGPTMGLLYPAMAGYAARAAPTGAATTVQGLAGAVFEGVGVSLGSLAGGRLYAAWGGVATFRCFGVGALACGVLHAAAVRLLPAPPAHPSPPPHKYADTVDTADTAPALPTDHF